MKALNTYITEKFQVSADIIKAKKNVIYAYQPIDKYELIKYIKEKIKKEGLGTKNKPLDLNDIDTSKIIDMGELFDAIDGELRDLSKNGYFDISNWDVSNVEDMNYMFGASAFNGDISDWNVKSVINMHAMFRNSKFDGDLSDWDVSNVKNMEDMFAYSDFTSKNGDISNWDIKSVNMQFMFDDSPLEKNPPKWYHG